MLEDLKNKGSILNNYLRLRVDARNELHCEYEVVVVLNEFTLGLLKLCCNNKNNDNELYGTTALIVVI